ncbi:hypothetical protein DEU56DRAFT_761490 [Suillus clintonianus]|uniref:uncharacterized protein n=1 Tax=Suillus clintonianus TaxID=1904413 RepID=UPI001B87DDBB|nr:uncharacterized protein DEU56DRAFT_761490 [Suillus clintonianus]KAG2116812.1 hypothetical protein DEU56DRAFT_761490 [Suillus clintonianus]
MSQAEVSNLQPGASSRPAAASSIAVPTHDDARQRWKIADLEDKLQALESGHAVKRREINYYMSQGRAFKRIVTLFNSIEQLICENDRRCDTGGQDDDVTPELVFHHLLLKATHRFVTSQNRLQRGYIILNNVLPWFHQKASDMEHHDYRQMLKKLRQGADSARGDDTSKLKSLVSDWVNRDLKPDPPVDSEDKHHRGFTNDACGRLLCPTELDWNNPTVRAGIRDRTDGHVVTEMSWPAFLYAGYTADENNLEEGLFKSKLLIQAFKAIFTSPSSAKEVVCDGDGANVIENNRRAKKDSSGKRVKMHVAQIINMHKVSPRSIAYVSCQLRFALSSVTSWRSVDGDFDYAQFWSNIVDFFECPPGRVARRNTDRLLAWWTRKVFGTSHRAELSDAAKAKMSVNALAEQRARMDDMEFDSE